MDQPEPVSSPHPDPDAPSSLAEEVRLLRQYLIVTLTACVIVTFCFNVYLWRQDRSTRGQNAQARELEQVVGASLGSFISQLITYSTEHPDVIPILTKHGIRPGTNAPAVTPASGTLPKAAAPAGGAKK